MENRILSTLAMAAIAAVLSAKAVAQEDAEPEAEPGAEAAAHEKEAGNVRLYAKTGLGYDSNAFQAPNGPYVDYYAGSLLGGANPTVVPQKKSGFFVPYEVKVASAKALNQDSSLLGAANIDGRYYPASKVSYASQYTMRLRGGPRYVLGREGDLEDTLYLGGLIGKHQENYTDHDTGLPKTTTVSGTSISDRYNYLGTGVEAAYKHKTGSIGYGLKGQYIQNTYDDPVVVAKLDHTFYRLAADTGFHLAPKTKLDVRLGYSVRDYSNRHSHDAQGVYAVANPLLLYSFNTAGAKLHHRISTEWRFGLEYGYTQRVDHFVGYNDYSENKFGVSLQYGADRLKAKLALQHFGRNYPNAFAYDVAGQPAKTYSGNDVKFKVNLEQSKATSLWTELDYRTRNSTDLRYAYGRNQIMAGMTWSY